MILHGIYDNGMVKFIEKELPKVTVDFVININTTNLPSNYKKLKGIWKDKDISDDYMSKLRKSIESREL